MDTERSFLKLREAKNSQSQSIARNKRSGIGMNVETESAADHPI
jgi:hypothetical protein